MTMTKETKTKPFNTVPRYIAEDYLNKKLTRSELILYLWLRATADIYGFTTTSIGAIRNDIFPDVEINTVEKRLLSLRRKKYVHFENHQGRTGSFRIEFGDWLIKGGGIKGIEHHFSGGEAISETPRIERGDAEPSHKLEAQSHKLAEKKNQLAKGFSMDSQRAEVISFHNEQDTDKEIENHGNTLEKSFKGTLTREFNPNNSDEQRCREIAEDVKDKYINPLRNVLRKDGLRIIEEAWGILKEDRARGKRIEKSEAAYLMAIINKLRQNR